MFLSTGSPLRDLTNSFSSLTPEVSQGSPAQGSSQRGAVRVIAGVAIVATVATVARVVSRCLFPPTPERHETGVQAGQNVGEEAVMGIPLDARVNAATQVDEDAFREQPVMGYPLSATAPPYELEEDVSHANPVDERRSSDLPFQSSFPADRQLHMISPSESPYRELEEEVPLEAATQADPVIEDEREGSRPFQSPTSLPSSDFDTPEVRRDLTEALPENIARSTGSVQHELSEAFLSEATTTPASIDAVPSSVETQRFSNGIAVTHEEERTTIVCPSGFTALYVRGSDGSFHRSLDSADRGSQVPPRSSAPERKKEETQVKPAALLRNGSSEKKKPTRKVSSEPSADAWKNSLRR